MQPATINPNLTTPQTFSYKDILVKKLVRAVACSVVSQIVVLLIYIIVANVNILSPVEWTSSILNTFTHLSTWIFVIIFSLIIFAQCLICAKDYVLMTFYCSTRFQQICRIFSVHNFVLLLLHVVTGGAFVWQILSVIESSNQSLTAKCIDESRSCLVEDVFFLIIGGFWTGFYFFTKVYISTKQLVFPIIQQRKFLQFRTNVSVLFKQSLAMAVWPTFYFALFYYFWGNQIESRFVALVNLDRASRESSVLIYVYLWWFATLYCFSNNLMRFFFHLFLTEPVQFPIVKENVYILTLQEAINMDNLPIIQNLACLDLFLLSQWSPMRRQLLFTLSQPGGHPHNWNSLTESVLKLFSDYTNLLKKSTEPPMQEKPKKQTEAITPFSPVVQSPQTDPSLKFRNLRNLSMSNDYLDVVNVTHTGSSNTVKSFKKSIDESVQKVVSFVKILFGINFLFGELPQVNIQKCLGNGQLIIWASQGISELAAVSLVEDKYGIVQKDLPVIISSLVQLKQSLDKLNKVPSLSRKVAALDDFNYRMKNAVIAAVKHSLFKICLNFGEYFSDVPLSKDVLHYLQINFMLKTPN